MHASAEVTDDWSDEVVTLAVEVLRMLADPARLRIAGALLSREQSVTELAAAVNRPMTGVSQHLAKMRMARLVSARKQGTSVLYRIDNAHVRQLVVDTMRHVEHLLEDVPAHHRAVEAST